MTEAEIQRLLKIARLAAQARLRKHFVDVRGNPDLHVWCDYLRERAASVNLDLTVCDPNDPPT